jgi:hypothetical protein
MKVKVTLRSVSIGIVEDVECDLPATATQDEIREWAEEHFMDHHWRADWGSDFDGDNIEVLDAKVVERKMLCIYRHPTTGLYAAVEIDQEWDNDDWDCIGGMEVTDTKTQAEWAAEVDGSTVSEQEKADYPYDEGSEYELVALQVIA